MAIRLVNAISYITDGEKTQDGILVGSHNCNADTTLREMLATKRKYGKMDKRPRQHFIISYSKEVRLETTMEIIQKFMVRLTCPQPHRLLKRKDNYPIRSFS